jgi:hypothetical protein
MRPGLVASHVVLMAFAGCVASESGTLQGGDSIEPGTGPLVVGRVVDTEIVPIPNATITVHPGDWVALSDDGGGFAIGPLEPGEYVVRAEKLGYASAEATVAVFEDQGAQLILTVRAVAPNVPYSETTFHVTFAYCWVSGLWGNLPCTKIIDYVAGTNISREEKIDFTFYIENPGLVDLLVELDWETQALGSDGSFLLQSPPGQPLTGLVDLFLYLRGAAPLSGWAVVGKENCGRCAVFDATPNKIHFDGITVPVAGNSTVPNHALFLNHRMEAYLTHFYNRAGPRDFTAVADA